jgi:hypothetical protein
MKKEQRPPQLQVLLSVVSRTATRALPGEISSKGTPDNSIRYNLQNGAGGLNQLHSV